MLASWKTDSVGKFDGRIAATELPTRYDWQHGWPTDAVTLTAYAKDYAVGFGEYDPDDEIEAVIRLSVDEPVGGRILDLEGQPLAGVTIDVVEIHHGSSKRIDEWLAGARRDGNGELTSPVFGRAHNADLTSFQPLLAEIARIAPSQFPAVVTDADGRFELRGVGRDRHIGLRLRGEGLATAVIPVLTRPTEPIRTIVSTMAGRRERLYGASFEHVASPGMTVEGIVRDRDSGQPLADVSVQSHRIEGSGGGNGFLATTTDKYGRYRLAGFPAADGHELKIEAHGRPYLDEEGIIVPDAQGDRTVACDIDLRQAVWAVGRVTDQQTGLPATGRIFYTPFDDNPLANDYRPWNRSIRRLLVYIPSVRTDDQGAFRVPVIPGRGLIGLMADDSTLQAAVGLDQLTGAKTQNGRLSVPTLDSFLPDSLHAFTEISPAAGDGEIAVDLSVRAATQFTLRFVDPQGRPLSHVGIANSRGDHSYTRTNGGEAIVYGVSPEKQRTLRCEHGSGLSAVVDLRPAVGEIERTITLHAPAIVTGRLLDEDGEPRAMVDIRIQQQRPQGPIVSVEQTDDSGHFELLLAAGTEYALTAGRLMMNQPLAELSLSPGEKVELGELTIDTRKPREPARHSQSPQRSLGHDAEALALYRQRHAVIIEVFADGALTWGQQELTWEVLQVVPRKNPETTFVIRASDAVPREKVEAVLALFREAQHEHFREERRVVDTVFEYRGTVVDDAGKPVEGAKISLNYWRKSAPPMGGSPLAVTDRDGKFQFSRKKSDFADGGDGRVWSYAAIVAVKEGYGFGAKHCLAFETTGRAIDSLADQMRQWIEQQQKTWTNVLTLPTDAPVRGRIVNTEGQPVAGATIEPINISEGRTGSLDAWLQESTHPQANFYSARNHLTELVGGNFIDGPRWTVVPPATTDDNGRFVLNGLGKERIAEVILRGPGIETRKVFVRTQPGETVQLARSERGDDLGHETYYPDEFEHVAGPSQ
ncbi:MAG: hypothetical protein KDA75_16255, partial [Planctomycetaceae bacterium]|nr:hypothetical protein [Planctomycetaceae bacterium]